MAAMPGGATKIEIPRWIQLVGLPILLLLLWVLAGAARHVVFLFLVAGRVALLLNPLVRGLGRVWIPRGLAVAIVYLSFAAAVGLAVVALATVVVNQTRKSADRVDTYFTVEHGQRHQTHAERDLDRLQLWLDHHHLKGIHLRKQGQDFLNNIGTKDVQKYTSKAISWAEGAAVSAYPLLFGTWVALTELIPYLGPWLGAVPPFVYALVVHPLSALWVGLLFLVIHQVEGHVVVPNVMGSALRLHPLLVIFGLLAGGEIYGLPGVLVALPLLAAGRAIWEFFSNRIELEPWEEEGADGLPVPLEVESESPTHIA